MGCLVFVVVEAGTFLLSTMLTLQSLTSLIINNLLLKIAHVSCFCSSLFTESDNGSS